jgi:hypothetical protein
MKQQNTGLIVKSKLEVPFAQIPNKLLRDPNLSLKAKGLLSILLSLPNDWCVYKTQLASFSKDGRDATIAAFDELVRYGYIIGVRRHNSKGQFAGYDYVVYSEPITPFPENPKTDNPKTENPSLQIKNEQIKNIQIKNTSNILGKEKLKREIIYNLNLTSKQFDILVENNFSTYWNPEVLDANKNIIEQYKTIN